MFDYARHMQLALGDIARRSALKAAAGVVALIGAGFLLAAFWVLLADHFGWGSLGASLAIGLIFVAIGVALIVMGNTVRHPVPSTEELRAEVETRVALATDIAMEKARLKAVEVVDTVENKVHGLVDTVAHKANRFADDTEARVQGLGRDLVGGAARKVGLTSDTVARAQGAVDRAVSSNAATVPPVLGALAVGIALASRFQSWRRRDDDLYDDYR